MRPIVLALALGLQAALCLAAVPDQPASAVADDGPEVRFYGLFKLDGAYDSCHTNPGNFVRWVDPSEDPDDDAFNMTANQTRVGLEITELADGRAESSARVEIDFYGGGAENKSRPMLRHAYFKVEWPESGLELLAGQTSDLFSPLVPSTLNYSVAWWAGNIGYRRPQVRLTKEVRLREGAQLEVAGALARTIGDAASEFTDVDPGEDAGFPSVQARLALILPSGALGVSGHWAEEEFDTSATGDSETFDSWSVNLDWSYTLERGVLKAELFEGQNLSAYLGGIGQGVNVERMSEIGSHGGWISLELEPWERLGLLLGATLEEVEEQDLEAGGRAANRSLFTNWVYSLTERARAGVELSYWTTEYKEGPRANALRSQFSLIYAF